MKIKLTNYDDFITKQFNVLYNKYRIFMQKIIIF